MTLVRLSALDAVFLPMETDVQPLQVGSLLVFDGPVPDVDDLRRHLAARTAALPASRRRLARAPFDLARPAWVDAGVVPIDDHLGVVSVPPPGDPATVAELVVRLMASRLDLAVPPWRMWLIDGLADGRWALLVAAHHAIADGVYGSDLALRVLSDTPLPGDGVVAPDPPEPSPAGWVALGLTWLLLLPLRAVGWLLRAAVRPRRSAARARRIRHGIAQVVHPDLPRSELSGPLGRERLWGWVCGDLAEVESAARRAGASVNDVFLAVLAGGYRRYLVGRGVDPGALVLRAIVPVSQRRAGGPLAPGNLASAMFVELPVGLADASQRLAEVARRSAAQKSEGVGASTAAVVALADHVPWPLLSAAFRAYARAGQQRVNVIASNVTGPPSPRTLLGRQLLDVVPYVPLGEEIRSSAGFVSCGGRVALALTCDAAGLSDPAGLLAAMAASWQEVVPPPSQ